MVLKKIKNMYEVKAFLRVKKGGESKRYTLRKRLERDELTKLFETGGVDYWYLSSMQMRSILKLTSPEDWLYRYIDKDPGLGGDRTDPDFRHMDDYAWRRVCGEVSGPMGRWSGIDLLTKGGEVLFDIWYLKWSHLLKPKFPVEVEIPLEKLKGGILVEVI